MSLFPGNRIGPYEIRALIGAGGMGEVYRATDSRLGRDVAIKMLPVEVAADAERLGRFRREAQVLASLNHPNIAAIHGLEDAGGTPCLVLELVEGEDLAQRLARGPIPPDEAIDIARHIAEALEEAHEKGIVHRDLKPANVKVTPDGKVKVLDFGLAKALTGSEAAGAAGSDLSQSPTLVQSGTRAGMILGTAAYMSPEQARGRAVDRRADIWAFGAVLWEMLTGTALFAGETITDVLAAVLTRDPDWSALPPSTPPRLAALLRRCLERDPRRRLQAMGEARLALEPGSGVHEVVAAPVRPARSRGLEWPAALGLALVGAAIGVAVLLLLAPGRQAPGAAPPRLAFGFDPPAGTSFVGGVDVSRDGRSIVFVARDAAGQTALWLRDLDAVEPRRLSGTDGARFPFWSPDGRRLGFFAGSQMKSVDLIGGAVKMIVRTTNTADVRGASWGADDVIVFAPTFHGPLFRITASGGKPEPATSVDGKERTHRWPCFLPDGRHFLFYEAQGSGMEPGETRLGIVGSTATRTLGPSNSRVAFLPPRKVLYARGRTLVAQELDVDRATLLGEPQALGLELPGSLGIAGFRYLAAAAPETLVTRFIESNTNQLVWLDRQGKVLSVAVDDGGWHNLPRLSPDGRRIAVAHYAGENNQGDIHVHDLDRHLDTRVTFDDDDDQEAVWSPDGRTLAVTTGSETQLAIVLVDPARPGEKRLVRPVPAGSQLEDWFPDGSLLLATGDDSGRSDLIRLPAGGGEPVKVVSTPFSEASPSLTPDGRWLAYVSDSTGREEVYVRSLGSGEEWRVSGQGGTAPTWRRDGRELFYLDFRGFIMAVPTTIGATFTMGAPQALFPGLLDDSSSGRQFDVTADGQRFLVRRSSETTPQPILVHLGLPEPGRIGP